MPKKTPNNIKFTFFEDILTDSVEDTPEYETDNDREQDAQLYYRIYWPDLVDDPNDPSFPDEDEDEDEDNDSDGLPTNPYHSVASFEEHFDPSTWISNEFFQAALESPTSGNDILTFQIGRLCQYLLLGDRNCSLDWVRKASTREYPDSVKDRFESLREFYGPDWFSSITSRDEFKPHRIASPLSNISLGQLSLACQCLETFVWRTRTQPSQVNKPDGEPGPRAPVVRYLESRHGPGYIEPRQLVDIDTSHVPRTIAEQDKAHSQLNSQIQVLALRLATSLKLHPMMFYKNMQDLEALVKGTDFVGAKAMTKEIYSIGWTKPHVQINKRIDLLLRIYALKLREPGITNGQLAKRAELKDSDSAHLRLNDLAELPMNSLFQRAENIVGPWISISNIGSIGIDAITGSVLEMDAHIKNARTGDKSNTAE